MTWTWGIAAASAVLASGSAWAGSSGYDGNGGWDGGRIGATLQWEVGFGGWDGSFSEIRAGGRISIPVGGYMMPV